MKITVRQLQIFGWSLSAAASLIAFVMWGQGLRWQFNNLSSYNLFPLFGLLTFSLLWSTYVFGFIRRRAGIERTKVKVYYNRAGFLILITIFLHPGLLVWQLWRDGFGLPPSSFLQNYVAPSLRWAALLGVVSFFVFLAYELHHKYYQSSWWKYVQYLQDAAIIAVFYHSLRLGSHLQHAWPRYMWYFYGLVLAGVLIDTYWKKLNKLDRLSTKGV